MNSAKLAIFRAELRRPEVGGLLQPMMLQGFGKNIKISGEPNLNDGDAEEA